MRSSLPSPRTCSALQRGGCIHSVYQQLECRRKPSLLGGGGENSLAVGKSESLLSQELRVRLPQPDAEAQHSPPPTPASVATCDKKYWSCPGANNLKVLLMQPALQSIWFQAFIL